MATYQNYNEWAQARATAQANGQEFRDGAPLLTLDQDKYKYGSFTYPLDLGQPGSGKDHFILFHINETATTQFKTRDASGGYTNAGIKDKPQITQNAARTQANGMGTLMDTPNGQPTDTGTEPTSNSGGEAQRTPFVDAVKQPINRVATTIALYMPPDIQVSYAAKWDAAELGAAADFTNTLRGAESKGDLIKSFGASAAGAIGTRLNNITDMNFKDALSRQGRLSINPHEEVIFNSIGFRPHSFNFRFTPESEEEALNVDNIIRAFKFYSAPEILRGTAGRFWIYPAEFDIYFYSNGKQNDFLHKISTCALTEMRVNYTAAGQWSAHRPHADIDGAPSVCTDISLSFLELEIMTKERILEGY